MIDLFADVEESKVIGIDEFLAIAQLKHEMGGAALKTLMEGRGRKAAEMLVQVDPNNVGAVAQLQARLSESSYMLDLLNLDEQVIREQIAKAEAEKKEEK